MASPTFMIHPPVSVWRDPNTNGLPHNRASYNGSRATKRCGTDDNAGYPGRAGHSIRPKRFTRQDPGAGPARILVPGAERIARRLAKARVPAHAGRGSVLLPR